MTQSPCKGEVAITLFKVWDRSLGIRMKGRICKWGEMGNEVALGEAFYFLPLFFYLDHPGSGAAARRVPERHDLHLHAERLMAAVTAIRNRDIPAWARSRSLR